MKTIEERNGYRLVATESIEYAGNYQVLDLNPVDSERHMPWIFSDLSDAMDKFLRLAA